MGIDWYPFFVIDYRRDTRHLTLEEDAAYRRLIDEYMLTRAALPGDDEALARIVGIPTTEWTRLADKVRRFFKARNNKLWHKRCEMELREQNRRHNSFRESGRKGGMATALKRNGLGSLAAASLKPRSSTLQRKKETFLPRDETEERSPVENVDQVFKKRTSDEAVEAALERSRSRKRG